MYLKDKKKITFAIVVIIIFIIGISFSIYDEIKNSNSKGKQNDTPEDNEQGEYLKKIDLSLFNNDKTIKWNLNSERLTQKDEGNYYIMDLLEFKAYEDDTLIYSGDGNKAEYDNIEKIISLSGNISINKNNLLLKTNTMVWEQENDIIRGENKVELSSSEFVIEAESFSAPLTLKKITFFGSEDKQVKLEWR